jgi:glycosyltransferase involved in cell wall biosynthesis
MVITDIKVSVLVITYNHEKFIQQCLESILKQKCSFKLEIIVSNDCSSDNTNNNILCVINNSDSSNLIKYYNHTENKGMKNNFIWTLNQCKGKYIAICEGDDYWTDPLKLQKQVDFLEENINFGGIANNSYVLLDNGKLYPFGIRKSRKLKMKEIVRCRQFATGSLLFRNNLKIPAIFSKLIAGDTPLFIFIQTKAPIYYDDRITSVYRRGQQGITATFTSEKNKQSLIEYNKALDTFTNYKYSKIFKRNIKNIALSQNKTSIINRFLKVIDAFIFKLYLKITFSKHYFYFDLEGLSAIQRIYFRIFK